jgi:hypothetical protein
MCFVHFTCVHLRASVDDEVGIGVVSKVFYETDVTSTLLLRKLWKLAVVFIQG